MIPNRPWLDKPSCAAGAQVVNLRIAAEELHGRVHAWLPHLGL